MTTKIPWQEEFDAQCCEFLDSGVHIDYDKTIAFLSQKFSELIDEIPDDIHDAALGTKVGYNATMQLKQSLKDKWVK